MKSIRHNVGRFRSELKGLAILWVVFFHAQLGLNGLLYEVQRIGYGGVDVFFFLSGFGLYHSLERDADPGRYLRRRAARLLPAYLPFCLLWLTVMLPAFRLGAAASVRVAMSNLFMIGFLSGSPQYINWYTGGLLLSLLLAPLFHAIVKPGKRYWLRAAALLAALAAAGLSYIGDDRYMAVSRLPVFALGMIAAGCPLPEKKRRLLLPGMAVFAAALGALYLCLHRYPEMLNAYAMYWHPFVVIAPALCVGFGALFALAPVRLLKPLKSLGEASFEIFLFNAWAEVLGKRFGLMNTPLEWLAGSALSVLAGCLYHRMVTLGAAVWKKHAGRA